MCYVRWRCRAARVWVALLVLPLASGSWRTPSAAAWRRIPPVMVVPTPIHFILQVGNYLVGEESDPQLTGHPNIRY